MNIHGYKKKMKAIRMALNEEESKKHAKQCRENIDRLMKASRNCSNKIMQLKETRKKGNRLHKKQKRGKRANKN